jgi:hypothetical protein
MALTARFCTKRWNIAYSATLNVACQGAGNLLNVGCFTPQSSSSMQWEGTQLRQKAHKFFDCDIQFTVDIRNTGPFADNAKVEITGLPAVSKTVAAGATWHGVVTGSLVNVDRIIVFGGGFNSNFRIDAATLDVSGSTN